MNKAILIGRLTKDAETRYGGANGETAVAKFTLAVDRQTKEGGADFITCVAFGKQATLMDKYGKKGKKFAIEGHINTGSYKDKEGRTVYTEDVVIDRLEFCETQSKEEKQAKADGFDDVDEMSLPFN